jgi:hypothetical protein
MSTICTQKFTDLTQEPNINFALQSDSTGNIEDVMLPLKVHFLAALYTAVDLLSAPKGMRKIPPPKAKKLSLYCKNGERETP